ncbi:MAG: VCBS repeat-containing protein [Bacteroidia bacterium]|nr:VCBS repeat-containing protein [Bacteroidia bacterium]
MDIFICNDDSANYVYKNSGDYFFKTNSLINTGNAAGNYASIWTDYDNDRDLDLYISKCYSYADSASDPRRINVLYQNDGNGIFTETAKTAGIDDSSQSWCADFGDIDNDGDLDMYLINHKAPHKLFENLGSGTFKDFDNDGFVDLLIAGNRTFLYYNNGDKTFTLDSIFSSIKPIGPTFAVGDINNDGFLDIYLGKGFGSSEKSDKLYFSNSNSNNYVAFLLQGSPSNFNAIGARLFLYGNWGVQTREVRSGESYGVMHSFRQNFGLGQEQSIDSLVIWWPSGLKQTIKDIEPNSFHKIVEGYDIVNLEKNTINKRLTIYPNPAEREIHLIIPSSKPPLTVTILDITGKIINSQNIDQSNNISIDVRRLAAGTYLIKIEDQKNSEYIGKFQIK